MRFTPRILVVDDEPQMLEFLSEVLRERGANPQPFSSSVQAAKLVNQEKFDAVFFGLDDAGDGRHRTRQTIGASQA